MSRLIISSPVRHYERLILDFKSVNDLFNAGILDYTIIQQVDLSLSEEQNNGWNSEITELPSKYGVLYT